MKQMLVAGALILSLVACGKNNPGGSGGNGNGGTTVTPAVPDAYNPDASATDSADTRVPYVGDWVWTAKLSDGSYQRGVFTIRTRGTSSDTAKNGGVGDNFLCTDAGCTNPTGKNYAVILTQITSSGPSLQAFFGNSTNTGNRVVLVDSDGKVTLNDKGRPVISGTGSYAETLPSQAARVAFVQIDATPDGQYGSVSLTDVLAQAQAAADQVTTQRLQALPSLDVDSILK